MKQIRRFCIKYTVKEWTWYNPKNGHRYILPHKEDVKHFSYHVGKSQKYYRSELEKYGAKNIEITEYRTKIDN